MCFLGRHLRDLTPSSLLALQTPPKIAHARPRPPAPIVIDTSSDSHRAALEETIGENLVSNFITQEFRESVNQVLSSALLGKETANFEFPLFTKNGDRNPRVPSPSHASGGLLRERVPLTLPADTCTCRSSTHSKATDGVLFSPLQRRVEEHLASVLSHARRAPR